MLTEDKNNKDNCFICLKSSCNKPCKTCKIVCHKSCWAKYCVEKEEITNNISICFNDTYTDIEDNIFQSTEINCPVCKSKIPYKSVMTRSRLFKYHTDGATFIFKFLFNFYMTSNNNNIKQDIIKFVDKYRKLVKNNGMIKEYLQDIIMTETRDIKRFAEILHRQIYDFHYYCVD